MKDPFHFWFTLFCIAVFPTPLFSAEENPAAQKIKALLRDSIEKKRWPGIAVGVVDPNGTYIFCEGKVRTGSTNEVTGDTIFQIGSVTKTFTTLLLQLMIDRGEVQLDEPIAKLLPSSVKMPSRNGREITLLDLATHTSGLPRMPFKTPPTGPMPYFKAEEVYKFLSEYELTRDIGTQYEYSNLGVGLLAHALSLKAGTNYEAMITKEICDPLKMKDTRITLPPEMRERASAAHNISGEPLPQWWKPAFVGAGAISSSANDMVKYVSAQLGLTDSPLLKAMQETQEPRRKAMPNVQVGLGWHVRKMKDGEIVSHNGATIGFHSFVGFDKQKHCGVVVLVNSANEIGELPLEILKQLPLEENAKAEK